MKNTVERRLKEISEKLGGKEKDYFVLYHKKHRRWILFINSPNSVNFIKRKFGSLRKQFIYFLIKKRILQLFIKKIKLSEKFGDAVFVGNQIKAFHLNQRRVCSFCLTELGERDFIKTKEAQDKFSKKGFAPKIIKIDKQIPYSAESLLAEQSLRDYRKVFVKLLNFYRSQGIEKTTLEKVCRFYKIPRPATLPKTTPIFLCTSHGDFAKQQIVFDKGSPKFIDWDPRQDLITADLFNFFRFKKDFLRTKEFREALSKYPQEVKENLPIYLELFKLSTTQHK